MAKRYSGNATIRLTYDDSVQSINGAGFYRVTIAVAGRSVWSGIVNPAPAGFGPGIAYDSPLAYDDTARAALAFAVAEYEERRESCPIVDEMESVEMKHEGSGGCRNTMIFDQVKIARVKP